MSKNNNNEYLDFSCVLKRYALIGLSFIITAVILKMQHGDGMFGTFADVRKKYLLIFTIVSTVFYFIKEVINTINLVSVGLISSKGPLGILVYSFLSILMSGIGYAVVTVLVTVPIAYVIVYFGKSAFLPTWTMTLLVYLLVYSLTPTHVTNLTN